MKILFDWEYESQRGLLEGVLEKAKAVRDACDIVLDAPSITFKQCLKEMLLGCPSPNAWWNYRVDGEIRAFVAGMELAKDGDGLVEISPEFLLLLDHLLILIEAEKSSANQQI